jgi:hypothetical protein
MPKFNVVVTIEADDKENAFALAESKILPDNAEVHDVYPAPDDLWAEIPGYPRSDWNHEAGDDNTILGYHQWADHQKDIADEDRDADV